MDCLQDVAARMILFHARHDERLTTVMKDFRPLVSSGCSKYAPAATHISTPAKLDLHFEKVQCSLCVSTVEKYSCPCV
jgi:hypothetical protein